MIIVPRTKVINLERNAESILEHRLSPTQGDSNAKKYRGTRRRHVSFGFLECLFLKELFLSVLEHENIPLRYSKNNPSRTKPLPAYSSSWTHLIFTFGKFGQILVYRSHDKWPKWFMNLIFQITKVSLRMFSWDNILKIKFCQWLGYSCKILVSKLCNSDLSGIQKVDLCRFFDNFRRKIPYDC